MYQLTEQGPEKNIVIHSYRRILAESTERKQLFSVNGVIKVN